MYMLADASMSIPLFMCQKSAFVDTFGDERNSLHTAFFCVWLALGVVVSLRAVCILGTLLSFQWVAGMAKRIAAHLSLHAAFFYFIGSLICGTSNEMLLAAWGLSMGIANIMLYSKLLPRSAVPKRRTQVTFKSKLLELDHYTHRLQQGGTACVVCLDDFHEGDEVARLPCGHNFHENCVRRWLGHQKHCPYRCSANTVVKREQRETQDTFADESADGGEHDMQLDIESSLDEEGDGRPVNSTGRSTSYWCTH
jgi:hypothetical protein